MIEFQVNGKAVQSAAGATTPLLDVLRNELDLKGSRYGCGLEQCGACMVLVDGAIAYACTRDVGSVAGRGHHHGRWSGGPPDLRGLVGRTSGGNAATACPAL